MILPHHPDFPYRARLLWGSTAVCALIGAASPGLSLPMRVATPVFSVLCVGLGFLAGWLLLQFHAFLWAHLFPRLLNGLCLFFFYFFCIGTAVQILIVPFIGDSLRAQGMSLGEFVAFLPAGMGAAAGAYRVLREYDVV